MNKVRVRFAPSPTGFLHIGGLRTALYDYLFARHFGGDLILRIEDTDQNRKVDGAVENLLEAFQKLGIVFNEGPLLGGNFAPYFQSQRLGIYQQYAKELVEKGFSYPCFCSAETLDEMRKDMQEKKLFPKYDRRCLSLSKEEIESRIASGEKYVLRLRMPDERTFIINDEIRGQVEIDTHQLDDQVIIKSDGFPTYHLAAVVDDHLMGISHVIRGEEWLSSTPKHIFLYECFGWTAPKWVHLPLILNPDRSKLSKRMNDVSVDNYLEKGYLKEALLNFVALLGWHGADDRELYSLDELCNEFTLERVSKAGAVFDLAKLDWMNGQYLRTLPLNYIADLCRPYFIQKKIDISNETKYQKVIEVVRTRATLLTDFIPNSERYYRDLNIEAKDMELLQTDASKTVIKWMIEQLKDLKEPDTEILRQIINQGTEALGLKGKLYYTPLNIALSFGSSCPELHHIIGILGIPETLKRLQKALTL
jgi:glutamyl-tRNA synthetase